MNKTFIALLIALFLSPFFVAPAKADWLLDRSGTLVKVDGYVLGDEDSVEIEVEEEKERERDMVKDRQESERQAAKQKLENQIEARKKIQEKTGNRSEVEVRSEEGRLKIKQEIRDKADKVLTKKEIEIKDGERFMVEGEDRSKLEINAVRGGELEMARNRIKTNSDMELKISDKNEISVTLPNGKVKEVELPDKALERLVAKGVITQTVGDDNSYELTTGKNGDPVYEVEGQVEKKLFGLFKLKFAQKMAVAAGASEDGSVETGDVVETESRETGWRRFFERLSTN